MNLVIDAGNTLTKLAVFEKNSLIELWKGTKVDLNIIKSFQTRYPVDAIIVSDVTGAFHDLENLLETTSEFFWMTPDIPTPLTIKYESIETLGTDRLAAAVASWSLFPDASTLTIQAGTCITYEITNNQSEYLGGSISPGLDMRLKALHTFTAKLPLVKKEEIGYFTGKTTQEAILAGVINGCSAEIDGIIDHYKIIFPDLMVVFGGGDTFFFDKRLKNRIFATANLVLKGLNIILEHNK
jgi:type III pantothenate kinase